MTVTIELLSEEALAILKDLERLKVLKLISPPLKPTIKKGAKKSRFAGRISADTAEQLQKQLIEMRKEWR